MEEEMRSLFIRSFILVTAVLMLQAHLNVIRVPEDFAVIQQAINASSDGDTVLVAQNTYYENINFNGRNILLTSYYILGNDVNYITSTVINGSQPNHPDTASCVLIVSGEDSSAILQGFTLTGGTGTKWLDEHGAGTYVEGGGILITLSSPTIRNNLIVENEAIRTGAGVTSAGGGGIRVGDGNPRIINNVIASNSGMYGGGIVLNYTGAIVRNNIIYNNRVYQAVAGVQTFGGGGIWVLANFGTTPKIIENNTIVGNASSGGGGGAAGRGGGLLVWATSIQAANNIIWGNTQATGEQIAPISGGSANVTYSLVEGGWTGNGNIDINPNFEETGFYLSDTSECIDAGNPDSVYNDPEDAPGMGKWPAKGTVRNDMGAYGGPYSTQLGDFTITSVKDGKTGFIPADFELEQNYPNPFNPSTTIRYSVRSRGEEADGFIILSIYDVLGNEIATLVNEKKTAGEYEIEFDASQLSSGVYLYRLSAGSLAQTRKMILLK
jgi:hypothetical protein